jgi:hypothetical protein
MNKKKIIILSIIAVVIIGIIIAVIAINNSKPTEKVETLEDKVRSSIETYVYSQVFLKYNANYLDTRVTSISIRENKATVYGVIDVRDAYNEKYKGKFSGTVEFEEKESGSIQLTEKDIDITTPTKSY